MSSARYTRLAPLVGCALLLLGSVACRTTPRGNENQYTGSEGSHEIQRNESNRQLAARLSILNPRSRRLDDGRLQVEFDLENTASSQTEFAWAVDWFDRDGFQVETAHRAFEPMALGGGAARTLKITSPTPGSVSWRLSITSRNEVQ
ncbi:MAG TPA: YcfL family protein [Planctomycetota bacterium]|nr:YcfL family protein [Planctomycetota bacterium]